MSIENNKIVNLQDAQVLYNDLRGRVETKSDHSPKYGTPVADMADKLVSDKYTEDNTPYLMRKVFDAEFDEECLVGGTVAWNQQTKFVDDDATVYQVRIQTTTANKIIISGTASQTGQLATRDVSDKPLIIGHKYLILCKNTGDNLEFRRAGEAFMFYDSIVFDCTSTYRYITIRARSTESAINYESYINVVDLTQAFGSTIADYLYAIDSATSGAGVAKLREWGFLRKPYYAYNAGSLQSVQAGSRVVRGFNQWDEVWELGRLNYDKTSPTWGQNVSTDSQIRSKNYIPVVPNTTYHCTDATGLLIYAIFYGADQNPVEYNNSGYGSIANANFTTPSNAHFMRFYVQGATTYANNICINLHLDGERDGEYEPYKSASYSFDTSLTLRGLPKLDNGRLYYDGDEYKADGTVTRKYGIVDLGSLTWVANAGTQYVADYTGAKSASVNAVESSGRYIISANGAYNGTDMRITFRATKIWLCDSNYATAASLKTALNGVYLVYELATPTTESATPFTPLQEVFPNGTEQFTEWGTRDVEIPVGHKSKYSNNHKTEIDKDINTLYDSKAPVIMDSASGAIASFSDGANSLPLGVRFDIDHVQDLHGQDSPYPAGGGKNKYSGGNISLGGSNSRTKNEIVVEIPSGSYYFSCSKSGDATSFGVQLLNSSNQLVTQLNASQISSGSTLSLSDSIVKLYFYMDQTDYDNNKTVTFSNIQIESGSSATTYAPYSNICPISGWTGAKVKNCGGVVHDIPDKVLTSNGITGNISSHVFTASGTASATFDKYLDSAGIPSGTYIMSGFQNLIGLNAEWYVYNATDHSRIKTSKNPEGDSVTIPSGKECRVGLLVYSGETVNIKCTPCLTTKVDTYDVTWQSNGTIYGGYGVVGDDGSVKVVAQYAIINGDALTWTDSTASSHAVFRATILDMLNHGSSRNTSGRCSWYGLETTANDKTCFFYERGIYVRDDSYVDASAFSTAITGQNMQILFELATPIEYDLSDITPITSLLGDNNVFADTGDSSVDYRADTELWIANRGYYIKPSTGIPSTDLASAVQTSLGKADTAYQKPSGGIPLTDLASNVQTVSGSTPSITGVAGKRYVCGTVSTLTITAPASGCIDVVFDSGSTATVLTVSSSIKWANGFDPTALEANTTYELNILDGELGVACSWT